MDWLDLLPVRGTLKSLLQHHSSKASILLHSAFFTVQLSHPYMTTGKTIALTRQTFVGKVMSLLFNMLSRLSCGKKTTPTSQWLNTILVYFLLTHTNQDTKRKYSSVFTCMEADMSAQVYTGSHVKWIPWNMNSCGSLFRYWLAWTAQLFGDFKRSQDPKKVREYPPLAKEMAMLQKEPKANKAPKSFKKAWSILR